MISVYNARPTQVAPDLTVIALAGHYLKRVRSILSGEWTAYPGSFADCLISTDDGESTKPERQRKMRSLLLRGVETGVSDKWIEIADVANVLVTDEDRMWFTSVWRDTPYV